MNTPKWLKYIGDRGIKTLKNAEDYIKEKLIQYYNTYGYGLYVLELKVSHIPIGICGFVKREYLDSIDIGFAILPNYERRGYIYEATLAILRYGENELDFTKIYAITSKDNLASQKLLKKLAFEFTSNIIDPLTDEELSLYIKCNNPSARINRVND
jgi:RimJ/RimL family protein N-acetyltransferase